MRAFIVLGSSRSEPRKQGDRSAPAARRRDWAGIGLLGRGNNLWRGPGQRGHVGLMSVTNWETEFRGVWDRGVAAWKAGRRQPQTMFNAAAVAFLASVGCSAQELFDFVDDAQLYGDFDFSTVLPVTALRRDYFLNVLGGKPTGQRAEMHELPAKSEAVDGISWLPRLIAKARLKLRGEMPPELMYGCAGDRPFLRRMKMDLAGFLTLVRDCGADDRKIVEEVKRSAGIKS